MLPKIVKFFMKFLFRVKISGEYQGGNENGHDKTLIIANHSSFIDGILLALFLPVKPVFVVHTEIAEKALFKFFLKYVEYLAVDPTNPMAMKKVINLLNEGRTVAIFPEGRITVTGSLMKVYSGAAFAATKTQATVIPVYIQGASHSYFSRLKGLFKRRLFPQLSMNIFPPTKIVMNESLPVRDRRNDAKDKMHQLMMKMVVDSREKVTIFDMLLDSRKAHGKSTMIYEDGITPDVSYDDLVKKSVALSVLLKKEHVSKRVGLLLPNANAGVITFYALQHQGKIPAMINYTAGIRAINAGLTACQAETIITSRQFVEKAHLQELIDQLSEYRVIYLEDLRQSITVADKLNIILKRQFPSLSCHNSQPDEEAVVLFTSGSEGLPKGVVHSHDSMLMNAAQIKAIYDFNPKDKFMICLPMFHVFGLSAGALLPVSTGSSAFLYPNPLHYRAIPEVVYDRGCSVLLSTSTFLNGYARFADPYDFHCLRYVIAGAEKLSPEVVKTYHEKFGIRVMEGYGATETAPVIAANTMMAFQSGSVGRVLPGVTPTLIPVPGIDSENHPTGKLVVAADNVMLGYLRADNPGVIEDSPSQDGKRIYDTGDIVEIDDNGFVRIKGRAKRFAKIAGEMVSLDTVEKLALSVSSEHHHAVVAIPDEKKGEALVLFTTDTALIRKTLQETAQSIGLPELAVPRDIRPLKEIPVFSSGKTNYPALSELAA
ncbi:MAG: bifunctional acyl-ACP--phospholipid O-acyltransferase/long-chain-fatty-acid--ACP ligase [Gammaproteobacteria bacterium]|nr:bifunctional acyl-ACP--phospholipid O-acyltransferase/long-chain-fatty-acid--ACP ligase [Gammaproteobacteria bacterium]